MVPYRPSKTITNRAAHTSLARVQSPESSAGFRLCLPFQFSFTVKQLVLSQCVPVLAPPLIYSATGQIGTVFTLYQSVAQKLIRYVTLLFRRSAWCSFPLVTEIATPQLMQLSFMCAWTGALSSMILVARAKAVWIVTLHSSMASTCTTERLPQLAHLIKCRRTVLELNS